jgi:hypothetical protein
MYENKQQLLTIKFVCTKFGQNSLKDIDSRVFTRMLRKDGSITISLCNFVGNGTKGITGMCLGTDVLIDTSDQTWYILSP